MCSPTSRATPTGYDGCSRAPAEANRRCSTREEWPNATKRSTPARVARRASFVDDVHDTSSAFIAAAAQLNANEWAEGSGLAAFGVISVSEIPFRRRREVIVHHSDLDLDGPEDWFGWPSDFVRLELQRMTMQLARTHPMGVATLPPAAQAAPAALQLAWLFGRPTSRASNRRT